MQIVSRSVLPLVTLATLAAIGCGDDSPKRLEPMPKDPSCGDKIVQKDEQCDDGNEDDFDGCSRCEIFSATRVALSAKPANLVGDGDTAYVLLDDGKIAVLDGRGKARDMLTPKYKNATSIASDGAGGLVAMGTVADPSIDLDGVWLEYWPKDGKPQIAVRSDYIDPDESLVLFASAAQKVFGYALARMNVESDAIGYDIVAYELGKSEPFSASDHVVVPREGVVGVATADLWLELKPSDIDVYVGPDAFQVAVTGNNVFPQVGEPPVESAFFTVPRDGTAAADAAYCGHGTAYVIADHTVAVLAKDALAVDPQGCKLIQTAAHVPGRALSVDERSFPKRYADGSLSVDDAEVVLDRSVPRVVGRWHAPFGPASGAVRLSSGDALMISVEGSETEQATVLILVSRENQFRKDDGKVDLLDDAAECEFGFQCASTACNPASESANGKLCGPMKRGKGELCSEDEHCLSTSCVAHVCS